MNKIIILSLISLLFMASCSNDDMMGDGTISARGGIRFRLKEAGYVDSDKSRRTSVSTGNYDKVYFYIADVDGDIVTTVRAAYDASTSEIYAEGLHEGDYRLLVLAIKGDESEDKAQINEISSMEQEWLVLPADLHKPLEAEYFYSCTDFSVQRAAGGSGDSEFVTIDREIVQNRIVGRMDFYFDYTNRYIENAVVEKRIRLINARFYTTLSGNGTFGGSTDGFMDDIVMGDNISYLFMPLVDGTHVEGEILHTTVNYKSEKSVSDFVFIRQDILPNHIHSVFTSVKHPDDMSPVMFITKEAYESGNHGVILSDTERKEVYTDRNQRSFNTARPLQLSVTDEGLFHTRFYSPRKLMDVTIRAKIPSLDDEFFDFAYFDSIPAFGDFFEPVPMFERPTMCITESGRIINVPVLGISDIKGIEFKLVSSDPYLEKLHGIKHGWTIYWGLFGGNPDLDDGGPVGNWMGIRPVHIRESVAFFLNFTYMIDMDDHERILNENLDKLYDDNKQPVTAEKVLSQMRQERTLQVGLVWGGNNVAGLGSPTVYGAWQPAWYLHYSNRLECSFMFHELGHVMGYGHSSSFTYGPWAEQLMNNFYIENLHRLPIDSPEYLKTASNPYLYERHR